MGLSAAMRCTSFRSAICAGRITSMVSLLSGKRADHIGTEKRRARATTCKQVPALEFRYRRPRLEAGEGRSALGQFCHGTFETIQAFVDVGILDHKARGEAHHVGTGLQNHHALLLGGV